MAPRQRSLRSPLEKGYKMGGHDLVYFTSRVRNGKDSHENPLTNGMDVAGGPPGFLTVGCERRGRACEVTFNRNRLSSQPSAYDGITCSGASRYYHRPRATLPCTPLFSRCRVSAKMGPTISAISAAPRIRGSSLIHQRPTGPK